MLSIRFSLLFVFLYLIVTQLVAQHDSYILYSKIDGVPSNNVYSCTQDADGFMWFGTDNGLCRYDGTNFIRYNNHDGLPDNEIIQVVSDKDGGIWGRTYSQNIFYYNKGVFYTDFGNNNIFKRIGNIEADENGGIWAYPEFIPYKVDKMMHCFYFRNLKIQKEIKLLKAENDERRIRFRNIEMTKNCYIAMHENFSSFFDKKDLKFIKTENKSMKPRVQSVYRTVFFKFKEMSYEQLDENNKSTIVPYNLDEAGNVHYGDSVHFCSRIINIYLHGDKLYLTFADGGYIVTDKYLSTIKDNTIIRKEDRLLSDIYIGKVYADKEENVWFTSLSGILFYPKNPIQILNRNEKLSIETFCSVWVDKENTIYAGSSLGLIYIKKEGQQKNSLDSLFHNNTRQNERVMRILQDSNKRLWYGTDKGIYVVEKGKIKSIGEVMAVKNMMFDKQQRYLYVSSHNKVIKLDLANFSFDSSNNVPIQNVLVSEKVFGFAEDTLGGIWLGGKSALFYYDGKTVQNISAKIKPNLLQKIQRLQMSKDGTLWIATTTEGLIGLKDQKIQCIISNNADGITDNVCTSLFIDAKNQVWVGTKSGLNKIIYQYKQGKIDYKITAYSRAQGLIDDEIQDVFVKDEKVYIATNKGLCILKDIVVNEKHNIEKAHIWRIKVAGKDTNVVDNYIFPTSVKQIMISFSRLCFACGENTEYEYRLLPEQVLWSSTKDQSITFNYLNDGKHQFEVRLKEKPGSLSTFSFTIETPFWKTKIAWFCYILLFAGILYFIIKIVLNAQIKKEREAKNIKHKISELEMKAIKSQMNPHFIFNCIQSIQYYYSVGDSFNANNYISKFAQLIRSTLEISEKPFIPIAEEATYLENYLFLEEMRFKNLFSYSIEIGEDIDKNRQMFPALLLQPYVENAIKHGIRNNPKKKGEIIIRFYKKDDGLFCEVEDNGVGRIRAKEIKMRNILPKHDSKGMKLSQNRILLLNEISDNANIRLEIIDKYSPQKEAEGTLIRIFIPLNFVEPQMQKQHDLFVFLKQIKRKIGTFYKQFSAYSS